MPFTSRFLYHMDSVHFALALDRYDLTLHQPHPPGYFIYIMLGRLLHYFIADANLVFVIISIFFSGCAVATLYLLATEMFDERIGLISALMAIVSPNLWFHGEVALTYAVECFFSCLTALFCWRIIKGNHRAIWLSALTLAIAGGFRQNTVVFLMPLWLYSIKDVPLRRILCACGIFSLISLSWLVPMIRLSGGWERYHGAFRDLWLFNTGRNSVFNEGWSALCYHSKNLARFTIYGLGAGTPILCLAAYSIIRKRNYHSIDMHRAVFLSTWGLPSFIFYLLIFIHHGNPGYTLIFLPALLILTTLAIRYISNEMRQLTGKSLFMPITSIIIVVNTSLFLFSSHIISYQWIKTHNHNLPILFDRLKPFSASNSAIFIRPYFYYGYRQIMYYLPDCRVYSVDFSTTPSGEIMKTFWGMNRQTYLSDEIVLPGHVNRFGALLLYEDKDRLKKTSGLEISEAFPTAVIASGPISRVKEIFPEVRIRVE